MSLFFLSADDSKIPLVNLSVSLKAGFEDVPYVCRQFSSQIYHYENSKWLYLFIQFESDKIVK